MPMRYLVAPTQGARYMEVVMKKFHVYRLGMALAAIVAVVVESGAAHKFS